MPVIAPQPPIRATREFDEIVKAASMFDSHSFQQRPVSVMTETTYIMDTDAEDESDIEEHSPKRSFDSDENRRRSLTTISSYDEVSTPGLRHSHNPLFELRIQPVEGPKGPHLFRSSQASSEFYYEHALQLSPLFPKEMILPSDAGAMNELVTPVAHVSLDSFSIDAAFQQTQDDMDDIENYVRSWSTQQVLDWMYEIGLDSTIIECFDIHDITGAVLLDLQFEDLRELDIQSFGKRRQLWSAISLLRGDDQTNYAQPSAHQENTRRTPSRSRAYSSEERPKTPTSGSKRRGRAASQTTDLVTPGDSMSIVAIEQLLPKPHTCAKGERCAKWRKRQRAIQHLQESNGIGQFPVESDEAGHSFVPCSTGHAAVTENITSNSSDQRSTEQYYLEPGQDDPFRPMSGVVPSVVASSDLLGPGNLPEFALHPHMLNQLGSRDPQDNVKQFLNFQHMTSPTAERTSSLEMFPSKSVSAFPAQQRPYPPVRCMTSPHEQLRALPKLDIPRSASANPQLDGSLPLDVTQQWICRSATASPGIMYRMGTPASEVDIPVTNVPLGPVSRDTSQSVPPNMQYRPQLRSQSRPADRRRPSLAPVKEGEVLSAHDSHQSEHARPSISSSGSTDSMPRQQNAHDQQMNYRSYGDDCSHAGWMKKRRTKMLRHEWQDAHFRLKGSQLAMHANARLSTIAMDTINVEDYAVTASSVASSSKLSAAMKALSLKNSHDVSKKDSADPTAFAFQLIPTAPDPERPERRQVVNGKTHHFAVKTKDERIDWMRALMLNQARQQKGNGYQVEINGEKA